MILPDACAEGEILAPYFSVQLTRERIGAYAKRDFRIDTGSIGRTYSPGWAALGFRS